MRLVRALLNILLAVVTLAAICVVLVLGFGLITIQARENMGLDFTLGSAAEEEPSSLGDWLWIGDQPIHYQTWGADRAGAEQTPWVVLVHGLQVEGSQTWLPLARTLERGGLRVLTVDLNGMGRSYRAKDSDSYTTRGQAETLAIVLNQLHVQQAVVVARGWGAAVSMELAYEQPQFVSRLVLVSPVLQAQWPPLTQNMARIPYVGRSVAWMVAGGGPYWRLQHQQAFVDTSTLPADYWPGVNQYLFIQDTTYALQQMMASPPDDALPEVLGRISQPVHILVGEQSAESLHAAAADIQKALPAATLETVPDAGDYMHIERTPLLAQQILDLLR